MGHETELLDADGISLGTSTLPMQTYADMAASSRKSGELWLVLGWVEEGREATLRVRAYDQEVIRSVVLGSVTGP
jgi:hypothetical protein